MLLRIGSAGSYPFALWLQTIALYLPCSKSPHQRAFSFYQLTNVHPRGACARKNRSFLRAGRRGVTARVGASIRIVAHQNARFPRTRKRPELRTTRPPSLVAARIKTTLPSEARRRGGDRAAAAAGPIHSPSPSLLEMATASRYERLVPLVFITRPNLLSQSIDRTRRPWRSLRRIAI